MLRALLGSSPEEVSSSRWGADGQFEPHLDRIEIPAQSVDRLKAAWDLVAPLCCRAMDDPGAQRKIVEEWTRVKAVTIGRADQDSDSDLATDTILDELDRYPADCVIRALKSWRAANKWRPSLADILGDVQWRARYRQCVREAFERAGVA